MDLRATSRVILSGASGMLGSAVRRALDANGIPTLQLVRRNKTAEGELQWDPNSDPAIPNPGPLEGARAAVHLSGANVSAHRWTDNYKREMIASRVDSTRRLATALAGLKQHPATLVTASAIGIYGDRGDEVLDEASRAGDGFLASLCRQWEAAAEPAEQAGIRVVHLRFGVVLGPGEGALKQMLPPFKLGLGARIGNGRQWMSWVGLKDVVAAVLFALDHPELAGPVNVTAPNPVTNAEFTRALGRQLHRPAFLFVPPVAMKLLFGQMAEEALLASARVEPTKLRNAGFHFSEPNLDQALGAALKK
ncbi:TIGR01777 family oxidoreductase [Occallatibacter savannae]|uniref:TIGR01777 family oxidoreductase n=1 Tax=Occallatibacter savannae TaxID=1002691 RepID=UPI000D689771|nr:TIGR01777 family oxidoreductase [Occallatibacter savannae]